MKNIYLLTILSMFLISCNMHTQKQMENTNEPTVIGSAMMADGTINPIIGGDVNLEQIWIDYVAAHNDRDLDKIAEINTDDWEGYTPDGTVIKGNEAHIIFLDNWFKTSNPKWKISWMVANASNNEQGKLTQWLTTGNDYTDTDEDGNEVLEHHIHDIEFDNGKIKKVNVYSRTSVQE